MSRTICISFSRRWVGQYVSPLAVDEIEQYVSPLALDEIGQYVSPLAVDE